MATRWISLGVGLLQLASSSTGWGADLSDVYAMALSSDPTFQSAQASLNIARQKRPEAFSALLPALSATGSADRTSGRTRYTGTPEVQRVFQSDQWVLELKQPLLRMDALWAYDESRAFVDQAVAQYAAAKQDLILRVTRAYFDIAIAQRHVVAAQAQLDAMKEQLEASRRSFEAGVASVTDVDDSRSRSALAEAQTVISQNDLESARAALAALTGVAAAELTPLSEDAAMPHPVPEEVEPWVQQAVDQNPAVKAGQAALKAADFELSRTRSQRLPSVDLVGNYGGNYSSGNITQPLNFGTHVRDELVSIQVSVPLFDGGELSAQVAEARARRAKAQADLSTAQRQATLDARQAYGSILSGISQVRALKAAVAAGQSAVKGNKIGYGLGIRINSDVLNAEQQLFGTVHDLEKTRYDVLFEGLKLKAAAGILSEDDVSVINTLLITDAAIGNGSVETTKAPAGSVP